MYLKLGKTLGSPSVAQRMHDDHEFAAWVSKCLIRHNACDWGDVTKEDAELNNVAVSKNARVLSVYNHKVFPTIWLVTEGDRSSTSIIFPSEY